MEKEEVCFALELTMTLSSEKLNMTYSPTKQVGDNSPTYYRTRNQSLLKFSFLRQRRRLNLEFQDGGSKMAAIHNLNEPGLDIGLNNRLLISIQDSCFTRNTVFEICISSQTLERKFDTN